MTEPIFSQTIFMIGNRAITLGDALFFGGIALLALFFFLLVVVWRTGARRREREVLAQALAEQRARDAEARMAELVASQNELTGRLAALQEGNTQQQAAMARQLDERLQGMTGRVSQSITETTKNTQESLAKLQERLAVIDTAQNNIQTLAHDVVGLQAILQNKQTRGAFGQSRMEVIVRDGLPIGSFEFQATLSNNTRPDCIIAMPNDGPGLVVDAKFPLEGWNAMREAKTTDSAVLSAKQFRTDLDKHIKDISQKYLIPGETQDTAFLFVPSESIFADIHESFEDVVQRAHRARVVIVSPSLLLLSIQVIQAVLKDARMREQAHLIQGEVMKLMEDMTRLDDRVHKLKTHFDQTGRDIDQILTSSGKVQKRGARIEAMEFAEPLAEVAAAEQEELEETGKPFLRAIDGGD